MLHWQEPPETSRRTQPGGASAKKGLMSGEKDLIHSFDWSDFLFFRILWLSSDSIDSAFPFSVFFFTFTVTASDLMM